MSAACTAPLAGFRDRRMKRVTLGAPNAGRCVPLGGGDDDVTTQVAGRPIADYTLLSDCLSAAS